MLILMTSNRGRVVMDGTDAAAVRRSRTACLCSGNVRLSNLEVLNAILYVAMPEAWHSKEEVPDS